jgi:hypothetical protein
MALSTANLIQENSFEDPVTATSRPVTLGSGTTAGNTIIVFIGTTDPSTTVLPPAGGGWILDADHSFGGLQVYHLSDVGAGVTSWTFTTATAKTIAWYVAEVSGLDPDPVDAGSQGTFSVSSGGTVTVANSVSTGGMSTIAFAAIITAETTSGHTYTYAGWTNSFSERADTGGPTAPGLAVAVNTSPNTVIWSTTATLTTTLAPAGPCTVMIAYREAGTPIVSPLYYLAGFEWGTHAGGGTLLGANNLWMRSALSVGTWGTNYLIQAGSARSGTYGLRIVQAGAAAYVGHGTPPLFFASVMVIGMNVRVVSGSGVVVVAEVTGTVATPLQIVYDVTATKFGVRCGTTGTIQYQSGTTALSTWVWIDVRVQDGGTTWTADWRIETGASTYTTQTSASLGGQTANIVDAFRTGSNTAQTVTADYDDVVLSQYSGTYPLGPHTVRILKVDPAGTPTISGTTANFNTFTANGTLAAWNATTARNAIDELPPTVSTSSDGVVQVTVAATEYMEFPMETYTLAATEVIAGAKVIATMWATSGGGTVTVEIRGWDGTSEASVVPLGSAFSAAGATAYATNAPTWRVGMWAITNGWTQAKLDAAAVRFGFSTNIAPGAAAIYMEIAVGKTRTIHAFGAVADVAVDPNRLGVVSATVTAPALGTGDTTLYYEEATVPTSVNIPAGTAVTEQINAAFEADVNYVAIYTPPEPDPVD